MLPSAVMDRAGARFVRARAASGPCYSLEEQDRGGFVRNAGNGRAKGGVPPLVAAPLMAALVLTAYPACGSSSGPFIYGNSEVVERSRSERPRWIEAPQCPQGRVCSSGSRTRAAALEHARTDARHDAVKGFASRLSTKVKTRFQAARQEGRIPEPGESVEVDQGIKELFAAASRLSVQDLHVEDFWWVKTRAAGEDHRYHYYVDYHVLVSMPQASWRRKVKALLERSRKKAQGALMQELDAFAKDILDDPEGTE